MSFHETVNAPSEKPPREDSPSKEPAKSPPPAPATDGTTSRYQEILFHQPTSKVETVLRAACDAMSFDIAEMWLRTGEKTHHLVSSFLRPTALDETVRNAIVDVYYGDGASHRTHRLSPALCKKAKVAMDVVWVTSQTENGAKALKCSLNDVRTAVAVPVCHETTNTSLTVIYFSVRKSVMRKEAVEFLVHMSLAAAVAGVNDFAAVGLEESGGFGAPTRKDAYHSPERAAQRVQPVPGTMPPQRHLQKQMSTPLMGDTVPLAVNVPSDVVYNNQTPNPFSRGPIELNANQLSLSEHPTFILNPKESHPVDGSQFQPLDVLDVSVKGADLHLKWNDVSNIEYLCDGGNNWIHTGVMNNTPVVLKQLKPECQDLAMAMTEIEGELEVHARVDHPNIATLIGAGRGTQGARFLVLERLDGGMLTQMLGYDTRIRDRRKRFWKKNRMGYVKILRVACQIASALEYCHEKAIEGCMVIHRDLKPDNIGFTLDGTVKIIDFGLARIVENVHPDSDDLYEMSGETGSLRYMAPEVAAAMPYNHKADVYSFGMILWEILHCVKPFEGMDRDMFYDRVVHAGERPEMGKKVPPELSILIQRCWSIDPETRPNFSKIVETLSELGGKEKGGKKDRKKNRLSLPTFRHSTWF